jgi:uncharacterized protein YdbL (DUF1318 family)
MEGSVNCTRAQGREGEGGRAYVVTLGHADETDDLLKTVDDKVAAQFGALLARSDELRW